MCLSPEVVVSTGTKSIAIRSPSCCRAREPPEPEPARPRGVCRMLPGRDVHAAGVSPRCGRSRPGGPTSGRRSDPGGPVLLFLVHTDNAIYDAVRVIDAIQGLDA